MKTEKVKTKSVNKGERLQQISVLFVCLGNVCRSPVAKGVFRSLVEQQGKKELFVVDSCGTGNWHIGQPAHPESRQVALRHAIDIEDHRARQLLLADFYDFNYIIAMDRTNYRDILSVKPQDSGQQFNFTLKLLRDFDPENAVPDVPDPYLGGAGGFENVHQIIARSCALLLNYITTCKN